MPRRRDYSRLFRQFADETHSFPPIDAVLAEMSSRSWLARYAAVGVPNTFAVRDAVGSEVWDVVYGGLEDGLLLPVLWELSAVFWATLARLEGADDVENQAPPAP